MGNMLMGLTGFNQAIGDWDVSSVTDYGIKCFLAMLLLSIRDLSSWSC